MTIIVDLQTIIDEAERGFFSIDYLKDIVEREKKASAYTAYSVDCCEREECLWQNGEGDNDHECVGFVQGAIIAQIEDLPYEQKAIALKNALAYWEWADSKED
jgi:hypothetical protein